MLDRAPLMVVHNVAGMVAMLEVDDVLDNQHWKFCADDPMADVATFDQFAMGPDFILDADTTVVMRHLWGHAEDGMTAAVDHSFVLPKAASVKRAVHVMMSLYHHTMDAIVASPRFFYIEQVDFDKNGNVEITWGT